ncbi:MAG: polysaccharide lyase family 7 protein [Ferrimonas sp.]
MLTRSFKPTLQAVGSLLSAALISTAYGAELTIVAATDWGGGHANYPAEQTIDGDLDWASRWVSNAVAANLVLDLGQNQPVDAMNIAWGQGAQRTHRFEIRTKADDGTNTWHKVYAGTSSGTSAEFEQYDLIDTNARWVRVKIFENSSGSDWSNITEVAVMGDEVGQAQTPDFNLDSSLAPGGNFDLLDWYLSIPVDEGDGYASSIKEQALSNGYEDAFFYTGADGGMVFYTPVAGVTTSSNTKYVRTELREMLRRGDTSFSTSGKANNWAFSSIATDEQAEFGGIDGTLTATLAVNHVTTTSSDNRYVGRIVIGQIHAESNEPIRLYYHKLPNNENGALYFAHEAAKAVGGAETWHNLLGQMVAENGDLAELTNPSDGLALDEPFSYEITVVGDQLIVVITQADKELAAATINMSESGYDDADNYMYFKAGIYLQDNLSEPDDYAEVTFYQLENRHQNYQ